MNALSVASAVTSTTLTVRSRADPKMTPFAVILNVLFASPPTPLAMSASALLTLLNTPMVSSARYSTAVATTPTISRTNDTANENFMTDQGSMRLTYSRARRGPRPTAAVTPARALRMASLTRAAPVVGPALPVTGGPAMPPGRMPVVVAPRTLARATADPVAAPVVGAAPPSGSPEAARLSGGGGMP